MSYIVLARDLPDWFLMVRAFAFRPSSCRNGWKWNDEEMCRLEAHFEESRQGDCCLQPNSVSDVLWPRAARCSRSTSKNDGRLGVSGETRAVLLQPDSSCISPFLYLRVLAFQKSLSRRQWSSPSGHSLASQLVQISTSGRSMQQ